MAGFRIEGNTSGNVAEVDVNNNLKVNLPTTAAQAGYAAIAAVNHDGVTGAARLVRSAEVSVNRRLRVGIDNLLFQDAFNYTAQNTAVWKHTAVTWTSSFSGGFLNLTSTAAAGSMIVSTYKSFPLYNGAGLAAEFELYVPTPYPTNEFIEVGFGLVAGSVIPATDGIFFRWTATGTLTGVASYAGTETSVVLSPSPTLAQANSYLLRIEQEEAQFWVNGVLLGSIATPIQQAGPAQSTYQPISMRIGGTLSPGINTVKIGEVRVFLRDINVTRSWPQVMAGLGNMGSQGQSGTTMGSTALMVNAVGTALVATAPSAVAPATVFLGQGGNVLITLTTAINTDVFVMGALVPVGTTAINGKSLVITGVKISGVVQTAFTGGPALNVYSLAFGATAGALSTAEGAASKAFRRIPLGIESYGATAAVGVMGQGIQMTFNSPVMVNAGEWYGVTVKNVGTVLTAGAILYTVTFDCHWE